MKCDNKKKTSEKNTGAETLSGEKLEQVNGGDAFNDLPRAKDKQIDDSLQDRG